MSKKQSGSPDTVRAAWEESLACAEKQIRLGKAMQAKGIAILNTIQVEAEKAIGDPDDLASRIRAASQAMERGAELERTARATILSLRKMQAFYLGS